MTDYHLKITDGEDTNYVVCTSALGPDEFAEEVYNSFFTTDSDSETVVHVKYIDCDGRWQSFTVELTLGR